MRRQRAFPRSGSPPPRPSGRLVGFGPVRKYVHTHSPARRNIYLSGGQVLIHAGSSGVGIAAIQLAVHSGAAAVFTTGSSTEKLDFCTKTLGATAGLNYKTQDFAQEILAATGGQGVDLIVDPVGQSHFQKDLAAAAKDGCVVLLAMMSGAVAREVNLAPILFKRLRIEGSTLRSRDLAYQRQLRNKLVEEALPGIVDGTLKVFVERVFDWKDVRPLPYHTPSARRPTN